MRLRSFLVAGLWAVLWGFPETEVAVATSSPVPPANSDARKAETPARADRRTSALVRVSGKAVTDELPREDLRRFARRTIGQAESLIVPREYADAEPLVLRARAALLQAGVSDQDPDVTETYFLEACICCGRKDHGRAFPLLHDLLKRYERSPGRMSPEYAVTAHMLATSLRDLGGHGEDRAERYRTAQRWYETSLEIRRALITPADSAPGLRAVAASLHGLGNFYQRIGRFADAERELKECIRIREKYMAPSDEALAWAWHDLGEVFFKARRYADAAPWYKLALDSRLRHGEASYGLISEDYGRLADLYQLAGQLPQAESTLVGCLQFYEEARRKAGSSYERSIFRQPPYADLAVVRLALGKYDEVWPLVDRAHGRALAEDLLESALLRRTPQELARRDSLVAELRSLESLSRAGPRVQSRSAAPQRTLVDHDASRILTINATLLEDAQEIRNRDGSDPCDPFPLDRIQRSLDRHTALVGWIRSDSILGKPSSWAFVVRDRGPVRWVGLDDRPGTGGSLDQSIDSLRTLLASAAGRPLRVSDEGGIRVHARQVYASWMQPLHRHLRGVRRLVVIPSYVFRGVPLETLIDGRGRLLADLFSVTYAPSATVYAYLRERTQKPQSHPVPWWQDLLEEIRPGSTARFRTAQAAPVHPLIVGDPPFNRKQLLALSTTSAADPEPSEDVYRGALEGDAASLALLPRLPGSQGEVKQIAQLFENPLVLLSLEASKPSLRRLAAAGVLSQCGILHFATHALVDQDNPGRSALVLSALGPTGEEQNAGNDALLTAREIARDLPLQNTSLVCLSGCRTAVGLERGSEGFIGLGSAFLQAGAHSLVVSLWRVEDQATALFMERFYENLTGVHADGRRPSRPMSKDLALNDARHYLRTYTDSSGRQPYAHPVYWSAFVLVGDPD